MHLTIGYIWGLSKGLVKRKGEVKRESSSMTNSGMYPDDGVIATEQQLSHYQMVIEKEPWWQ